MYFLLEFIMVCWTSLIDADMENDTYDSTEALQDKAVIH